MAAEKDPSRLSQSLGMQSSRHRRNRLSLECKNKNDKNNDSQNCCYHCATCLYLLQLIELRQKMSSSHMVWPWLAFLLGKQRLFAFQSYKKLRRLIGMRWLRWAPHPIQHKAKQMHSCKTSRISPKEVGWQRLTRPTSTRHELVGLCNLAGVCF